MKRPQSARSDASMRSRDFPTLIRSGFKFLNLSPQGEVDAHRQIARRVRSFTGTERGKAPCPLRILRCEATSPLRGEVESVRGFHWISICAALITAFQR